MTLQKACETDKPIRVIVVDDYEPWLNFVSTTLQKEPELEIIGRVSDGLEAVRQAELLQPDLILLDIGLPTLNGIEAARRIREVSSTSKILFVSENHSVDLAERAFSLGARGYVVKSNACSELLLAVRAVLSGKRFISAALAGHFLAATTLGTTQTVLASMIMLISGIG
jgi:DNA-binding NarL/FixJ family response regulator